MLCTVYPKKYAHGFCFAVLCCGYTLTDFPISIRLTSLALWQSNDCPSASKATLMNMDKYFMWIHYERLHNHNKAKHNKTVCIFLGIYCTYAMLIIAIYTGCWNKTFEGYLYLYVISLCVRVLIVFMTNDHCFVWLNRVSTEMRINYGYSLNDLNTNRFGHETNLQRNAHLINSSLVTHIWDGEVVHLYLKYYYPCGFTTWRLCINPLFRDLFANDTCGPFY